MSKPNEYKPGYKHTPLGWIPEKWCVKDLKDVASIKRGRFSPRPRNDPKYYGGTTPFVQTGDVTNSNGFIVSHSQTLNEEGLKVSVVFPAGTILMTIASNVGHTAILEYDMACPDSLVGIVPNLNTDAKYLLYFFQFNQKRIQYIAPGAQKNINIEFLEILTIVFPQLSEQKRIATILSTWDEAITKTQQLIAQLQQRNKGLMQQLLTGKKRLKGFEGDEFKRLPANEIFKSASIKNHHGEQLLSATQDKGIIPRSMLAARVTMPVGETDSFKLVEKGDFVISLRSFQGGIEYSEYKGLVSPAYTVLKPVRRISDSYYRHYFKSYDFIGHLAVAVIGIRDGKQVSYEDFSFLKLPYPSFEEQEAIAEVLNDAGTELKLLEQKLSALQKQKKGLMQKLLTGEVRVNII